jgi:hypothetical protein
LPYETQSNIILSGSPDPLDGYPGSYDSLPFDQTTDITMQSQRYSVWQINYVYDNDGTAFMQLSSIREVPNLSKFKTLYGNEFSSTQWYKDSSGFFNEVPLLTATQDVLWYQDSTNPEIFGQIQLVDSEVATPINIDDIVGAKNYTSPNGVVFTNGLKVQFRGVANPAQFQNLEYYVEGVGTGPGLDSRVGFIKALKHSKNKIEIVSFSNGEKMKNTGFSVQGISVWHNPCQLTLNKSEKDEIQYTQRVVEFIQRTRG